MEENAKKNMKFVSQAADIFYPYAEKMHELCDNILKDGYANKDICDEINDWVESLRDMNEYMLAISSSLPFCKECSDTCNDILLKYRDMHDKISVLQSNISKTTE